jgi:hypothetical protein
MLLRFFPAFCSWPWLPPFYLHTARRVVKSAFNVLVGRRDFRRSRDSNSVGDGWLELRCGWNTSVNAE